MVEDSGRTPEAGSHHAHIRARALLAAVWMPTLNAPPPARNRQAHCYWAAPDWKLGVIMGGVGSGAFRDRGFGSSGRVGGVVREADALSVVEDDDDAVSPARTRLQEPAIPDEKGPDGGGRDSLLQAFASSPGARGGNAAAEPSMHRQSPTPRVRFCLGARRRRSHPCPSLCPRCRFPPPHPSLHLAHVPASCPTCPRPRPTRSCARRHVPSSITPPTGR